MKRPIEGNSTVGLILAGLLGLASVIYIARADITNIIAAFSLAANTHTLSADKPIIADSSYSWIWTVRGTANITLKLQVKHLGVYSDTLRLDSFLITNGIQSRYIARISADSMKNLWLGALTDTNNTARAYERKSSDWQYRLDIHTKYGTNSGVATASYVYN